MNFHIYEPLLLHFQDLNVVVVEVLKNRECKKNTKSKQLITCKPLKRRSNLREATGSCEDEKTSPG